MFKNSIKYLLISSLVFLLSCGYTPIYSKKNNILYLDKISYSGDQVINDELKIVLQRYKKNIDSEKLVDLVINSSQTKKIIQKNTKGEASSYEISLFVNVEAKYENKIILNKILKRKGMYAAKNSRSEEKTLENRLLKNMSREIANQVVLDTTHKLK